MISSDRKAAVLGAASRVADIPNRPGQWGTILSSVAALGWVAALLLDPTFPRWSSSLMLVTTFVDRWAIMTWLACVAFLPVIGITLNFMWLRLVAVNMGLTTWGYMMLSAVILGPPFPSSLGIYLALFLACLNAENRFWLSRVSVRQEDHGR
jgi:hypothetical protein